MSGGGGFWDESVWSDSSMHLDVLEIGSEIVTEVERVKSSKVVLHICSGPLKNTRRSPARKVADCIQTCVLSHGNRPFWRAMMLNLKPTADQPCGRKEVSER